MHFRFPFAFAGGGWSDLSFEELTARNSLIEVDEEPRHIPLGPARSLCRRVLVRRYQVRVPGIVVRAALRGVSCKALGCLHVGSSGYGELQGS
eukprot:1683907-Rhodomonas_salina.1